MLYTKDGFPEVNEIVKCTVTKLYGNTVFVSVDEYEKEGVLTISEIAPGRIRNMRDHVSENRVIICKVLRVDSKHNRIDVSLRRVPLSVRNDKLEQLKKEEYSDRIYEDVSKEVGITKDELFEKTYEPIFEEYETVFEALYNIMLDNYKINIFKVDQKIKDSFLKVINDRIKPEEVELKKKFILKSFNINGIIEVKNTIDECLKPLNYSKFKVFYLAAGEFGINIIHDDMRSAANLYNTFIKSLEQVAKEKKLILEIK